MIKNYSYIVLGGLFFSIIPVISHAGFLSKLLGFGSFESCLEDGLDKAKTSGEITKVYENCKLEYPGAIFLGRSQKPSVSAPLVPLPTVPQAVTPLVPIVPTPIQ